MSSAASWKTRFAGLGVLVVVAVLVAACSSTNSSSTTTTTGSSGGTGSTATPGTTTGENGRPAPPESAMSDHTGVTASEIHVANIATLSVIPGLFKGALVGAQAYFDEVNQQGGVGGRKIVVDSGDDQFSGSVNHQLTQSA
ncbi:MAG: ABC transporter substrate-binding protein, partial [Acidimicrobiales bacterium]|nr:ABC transporter substrate-binding protein [Acidimicrobiales bacterium]